MSEFWDIFKKLPWHKITAPILPVLLVDVYLGKYLMDLHVFNVNNDLLDRVPTNNTFSWFFITNVFAIVIFLGINTYHNFNDGKMKYLKTTSKLKLHPTEK